MLGLAVSLAIATVADPGPRRLRWDQRRPPGRSASRRSAGVLRWCCRSPTDRGRAVPSRAVHVQVHGGRDPRRHPAGHVLGQRL